jgi:putative membrane protein
MQPDQVFGTYGPRNIHAITETRGIRIQACTDEFGRRGSELMWGNYGMSGWFWGFGVLVVIGVVILVIVVVRMLANPRTVPPRTPPTVPPVASSPKQILDKRYAKGELTTEEYRERLSALGLDS